MADLARNSLNHQIAELSALDGKAATLVGLVGVLLGLLFTSDYVTKHWTLALSIGAGSLGASALSLVVAIWPTPTQLMPHPLTLLRVSGISPDETHYVIASATAGSISKNQGLVRRKRLSLAIAAFGVIASVVVIAGHLIYALS